MPDVFRNVLDTARSTVMEGLDNSQKLMEEIAEAAPGILGDCLKVLVKRQGKRIRATFLFLLAKSSGRAEMDRAVRVTTAIELLHLASLIHDDIIDGSELRRNDLTAHVLWGPRLAVLVGDYALSKGMELIWSDPDRRIPLSLSRASSRLIAGEVLELSQIGNTSLTLEQYIEVIEGKTGSLLQACGECGAILAGYNEELVEACGRMGQDFGIAFQVIDDLLDFGFGAKELGKKTHTDVQNGFITLPIILFLSKCSDAERTEMLRLLDPKDVPENIERITNLLKGKGAFSEAREMAQSRLDRCVKTLERLPDNNFLNQLSDLCTQMASRSA